MIAGPAAGRRAPATRIGALTVEIIGTDLPGRTCGPDWVGLTDEHGWPHCATVRPPTISWTVT